MTVTFKVDRNAGHPWDGQARPAFDHLYINASTQAEMDAAVAKARSKFWKEWLIGIDVESKLPGGIMYKPSGINEEWEDGFKNPHPGGTASDKVSDDEGLSVDKEIPEDTKNKRMFRRF